MRDIRVYDYMLFVVAFVVVLVVVIVVLVGAERKRMKN